MISRLLKSRIKRIGKPAGYLGHLAQEKKHDEVGISVFDYNATECIEKKDVTLEDALYYLNTANTTWINIHGVEDADAIAIIGKKFGLHPLMLEDIMSLGQRSKLDDYKDTIYIVVKMLTYNEKTHKACEEQVSLVLGKNYVISFLESNNSIFQPISERLLQANSRMTERGADYLCYALLDSLVDNYFIILEKVDAKLEHLEMELFDDPIPGTLQKIHLVKREINFIRKSIWPMREVISNFRRIDSKLIQDSTKLYIQDVYDHTIQAIDTIESFRDLTSGMLEIYISNLSQKLNEVMKVLTVVATIFVPLTFVASVYGMNFENLPGIHWELGYQTILGTMVSISIGMLIYFRRKRWI